MSIFASKDAFMQLGVEQVAPSTAHMYQDCSICNNPLDINIHTAATDAHHEAVRIGVCGHMHGKECLAAWLDAGNSCPICKRMLFEASGRSVSQVDINHVVRSMRHVVSEKRVMSAIARLMGRQELERAQLRRNREVDVENVRAREARSGQDDLMDDDEWMESGDEDFDMDAEDTEMEVDEEDFSMEQDLSDEQDLDGGIAIAEDDAEPKPATS